jgi:hypothetical protein
MAQSSRQKLIKDIELSLGGGIVDVELDADHYNLSIDHALERYRQRSSNATEESMMVLSLTKDQSDYTLPDIVIEVKDAYRTVTGISNSTGNDIEPFEAAYLNTYLLHSGRAGGLLTFEAYAEHREMLGRMFGSEYLFTWKRSSKTLSFHRKIKSNDESIILHCYNYRPEDDLLSDTYAGYWLRSWAVAESKMIIAEARSKFSQIAGPQGGTTLNGEALRQDAATQMDKLEQELVTYADGGDPLHFVIG